MTHAHETVPFLIHVRKGSPLDKALSRHIDKAQRDANGFVSKNTILCDLLSDALATKEALAKGISRIPAPSAPAAKAGK